MCLSIRKKIRWSPSKQKSFFLDYFFWDLGNSKFVQKKNLGELVIFQNAGTWPESGDDSPRRQERLQRNSYCTATTMTVMVTDDEFYFAICCGVTVIGKYHIYGLTSAADGVGRKGRNKGSGPVLSIMLIHIR